MESAGPGFSVALDIEVSIGSNNVFFYISSAFPFVLK